MKEEFAAVEEYMDLIGISYDDDPQKVIVTIQKALQKIPEIVAEPAP